MAGDQDDWLLDSLEKYEGVYMFELPHVTDCLEWDSTEGVWVACHKAGGGGSEVLLLSLPERLLPEEHQTLWAKRDFKMVCGGLADESITCIKTLSSASQQVVTSNSNAQLQVWATSKQSSDLLEETDAMPLWPDRPHPLCGHTFLDTTPTSPSTVLIGSSHNINSVYILDLPSRTTSLSLEGVSDHTPFLHCLQFLPHLSQLVTCAGGGGEVGVWDSRVKSAQTAAVIFPPLRQSCNSYSLASTGGVTATQIARLACNGKIDLLDIRHPNTAIKSATIATGKNSNMCTKFSKGSNDPLPCVQYSPSSPYLISTSGIHRGVHIFDTSQWPQHSTDTTPTVMPIFTHDGHEIENSEAHVLRHIWQPCRQSAGKVTANTILSTDSTGSLHAWQWKIK